MAVRGSSVRMPIGHDVTWSGNVGGSISMKLRPANTIQKSKCSTLMQWSIVGNAGSTLKRVVPPAVFAAIEHGIRLVCHKPLPCLHEPNVNTALVRQ